MKLSDEPIFIGLAGTLNAGKDSLGDILAEEFRFMHTSTSDMIREMKKREFGDTPQALLVRNDPYINRLRDERGPGFLIDAVHDEWIKNKDKYPGGFVASAMRAKGEAEEIKRIDGIIVFIDANPRVRYARSQLRQRDANEKNKSFDEFIATERLEIDVDPADKSVQNLSAMKDMADVVILNDGDDVKEFQREAVKQLREYLQKR